jgi:COMPASS component SWD1
MNLAYLDPNSNGLPDSIESQMEPGGATCATCCKLCRRGNYLAVGTTDGCVLVYDFMVTNSICRRLKGHEYRVLCVSWGRRGKLLSAGEDGHLKLWDVETKQVLFNVPFEGDFFKTAVMHPRDDNLALVSFYKQRTPVLVDFESGVQHELTIDDSALAKAKGRKLPPVALFSQKGTDIFVGSCAGTIQVFATETREVAHTLDGLQGFGAILEMHLDQNGEFLLVSSQDNTIRMLAAAADHPLGGTPVLELADRINRTKWARVSFNGDGEYIVGVSLEDASHQLFFWERFAGRLIKQLPGPKERLVDLDWHPHRAYLVTVAADCRVHIWGSNPDENWSAFAPNFTVLEENYEYVEREDEFDKQEEEDEAEQADLEREDVDIETVEPTARALGADSGGEEGGGAGEDALFFFTAEAFEAAPEEEREERGGGGAGARAAAGKKGGGAGRGAGAAAKKQKGGSAKKRKQGEVE